MEEHKLSRATASHVLSLESWVFPLHSRVSREAVSWGALCWACLYPAEGGAWEEGGAAGEGGGPLKCAELLGVSELGL